MTEDITRMLKGALPEDSDPQEWGPLARKRSRDRRVGQTAAVAALVLAVGIPVGYLLTRPNDTAVPAQTPSPVSDTNPCAGIAKTQRAGNEYRTPLDGGKLPDGATRAWLCGNPNDISSAGPAEPLTVGVDQLVSMFNSLGKQSPDVACTEEYRLTYGVVVDYDGDRKVVSGELHGCGVVSDGQTELVGGEELLAKAKELWSAQRVSSEAPANTPTACPPTGTILPASVDGLRAGFACTGGGEQMSVKPIPAELLAEVKASLGRDVASEVPGQGALEQSLLVLVDEWGSMVTLLPNAGAGFGIVEAGSFGVDGVRFWVPDVALEAKVRALFPAPPTDQPSGDICIGAATPAQGDLSDVVSATACVHRADGGIEEVNVDGELAKLIVAESVGKWEPTGQEQPAATGESINLINAAGEVYTLNVQPDGGLTRHDAQYQAFTWMPSGDVAAKLAEVLGR